MRATICNIGINEFFFSRSYSQFHILPCPPSQPFALTFIDDASDRIDMGEKTYHAIPILGTDIARDLVENEHLAVHGVFVCDGARPTAVELEKAEAVRLEYYKRMIAQGDGLWAKYHRHELIDDNSRRAALALGEDREWAFRVVKKIDCPGCGQKILTTVAKHTCGCVVDIDRAERLGMIPSEEAARLKRLRKQAEKKDKAEPKVEVESEDDYVDPAEEVLAAKK